MEHQHALTGTLTGTRHSMRRRLRALAGPGRAQLVVLAVTVGVGAGFGAVGFRFMIQGLTVLFTGFRDYAGQGRVGNPHLPGLGRFFVLLAPVVAGALYGLRATGSPAEPSGP